MVRFNGRLKRSARPSFSLSSPENSPNLQDPVPVKKGIEDESIKSPEPEYRGSPPASLNEVYKSYLFNEKDIRQKLNQLYEYKDIHIKDLDVDAMSMYQYIQSYVRILYGTNEYPAFYACVRDVFSKSDKIKIGTVGAYFNGCTLSIKSPVQKGCSPVCAGALPVPTGEEKMTAEYTCQYPVYIGVYSDGMYKFTNLNNNDKKENVVVFLVNGERQATVEDVKYIKSLGVKSGSIYGTSETGDIYTAITNGFVSLDTLSTFHTPENREETKKDMNIEEVNIVSKKDVPSGTSSSGLSYAGKVSIGLLVAVIVIIIIALIVQVSLSGLGYYKNSFDYPEPSSEGSVFEGLPDWFEGIGSFFRIKY